jgi:hypothetical protein
MDDPLILDWSAPATEGALQECSRATSMSSLADVGAQHSYLERHTLLDHFRQDHNSPSITGSLPFRLSNPMQLERTS